MAVIVFRVTIFFCFPLREKLNASRLWIGSDWIGPDTCSMIWRCTMEHFSVFSGRVVAERRVHGQHLVVGDGLAQIQASQIKTRGFFHGNDRPSGVISSIRQTVAFDAKMEGKIVSVQF